MRIQSRIEDEELVLELRLPKQQASKLIKDLLELATKNADSMEYSFSPTENIYQGFLKSMGESEGEKQPDRSKFIPPTLEQVRIAAEAYCKEKNLDVDSAWIADTAEEFRDYWEAFDWKRGKTKIRNWPQALRNRIRDLMRRRQRWEKGNGRKQRRTAHEEFIDGLRDWRREDLDH